MSACGISDEDREGDGCPQVEAIAVRSAELWPTSNVFDPFGAGERWAKLVDKMAEPAILHLHRNMGLTRDLHRGSASRAALTGFWPSSPLSSQAGVIPWCCAASA
jgi:hypothetical protein